MQPATIEEDLDSGRNPPQTKIRVLNAVVIETFCSLISVTIRRTAKSEKFETVMGTPKRSWKIQTSHGNPKKSWKI